VVNTDANGVAATEWYLGPRHANGNTLEATVGNATAEFSASSVAPPLNIPLLGTSSYVEYIPGDLPIIVSAPHGGALEPASIPDRTVGTSATDLNTVDLARKISDAIFARSQQRPHLILCHLRRTKLDANRTIPEAAQGNREAQRAWYEYHAFIDAAKSSTTLQSTRGLYLDIHGHGHVIQRLELGYLLSGTELEFSDATLDGAAFATSSSIRSLWVSSGAAFSALLRGPFSLGTLLHQAGFPSVPSATQPHPGGADYFTGGYSTERHGSQTAGTISAIQIEANFTGVRDNNGNRTSFANALAAALEEYLVRHFLIDITP
jgi:hypothetical protein